MENGKKSVFSLVDDAGVEREYEMLFTFDSDETKKNYMVYTDHSKDGDGKERVFASVYDPTGLDKTLYPIETEKERNVIENILSSIQSKVKDTEDSE